MYLNDIGPDTAALSRKGAETANKQFAAALEKRLRSQDAELKDWSPSKRVAVFRIKHFSRYSLLSADENSTGRFSAKNSDVFSSKSVGKNEKERENCVFGGFLRGNAKVFLAAAPKNFALEMGRFRRASVVESAGGKLAVLCAGGGGRVAKVRVRRGRGDYDEVFVFVGFGFFFRVNWRFFCVFLLFVAFKIFSESFEHFVAFFSL